MSDLISRADAIDAIDDAIDADSPQWAILRTKIGFLPSAEIPTESTNAPTNTPTDLISRADAIEAFDRGRVYHKSGIEEIINALPSAEANPTVVRCKTMIPYGDFREWAKRIREDNPNVIVIPFDAEVASADAVKGEWIHDGQNFKGGLDWCHCSVCGQKTSTNGLSMYNFCPSCGAKMYKGGDNE